MNGSEDSQWSIVIPVKDEKDLLRRCLPTCYTVHPSEVVICFDKPAPEDCVRVVRKLSEEHPDIDTRIVEVEKKPEWSRFHQAYVRRTGFRAAKYDTILTVDTDLLINANVLKAVRLVGKNNIGLASCSQRHPVHGLMSLWKTAGYQIARRRARTAPFTGLYAFWRPYWLDSEDHEGLKMLENPKTPKALGGLAAVGEDTYLRNCMVVKHRVVYLRDIGGYCMTRYVEEVPRMQFERGRYVAAKGYPLRRVLVTAIMFAQFYYLCGYIYQNHSRLPVPIDNPYTYPYSISKTLVTKRVPRQHRPEQSSVESQDAHKCYEEKRRLRYAQQDYMLPFFRFDQLGKKKILEIGSGSGIDTVEMLKNGADVVSVDSSAPACKATKALLKETGHDGNVVRADARLLPFRTQAFDVVYSYGVLHHIPDVWQALEEIQRTLRRKGLCMGMVYNYDGLLYAFSVLSLRGRGKGSQQQGMTEQEIALQFLEMAEENPYTRCYNKDELNDLLSAFFTTGVLVRAFRSVADTLDGEKVKFKSGDEKDVEGWHLAFRAIKR